LTLVVAENMIRDCAIRFLHVCPAREFLWCPLHIIFVTKSDSFYVKNYINGPEGYAADLYHNVSLFIECLEGHS
jgi:hypothetical protein